MGWTTWLIFKTLKLATNTEEQLRKSNIQRHGQNVKVCKLIRRFTFAIYTIEYNAFAWEYWIFAKQKRTQGYGCNVLPLDTRCTYPVPPAAPVTLQESKSGVHFVVTRLDGKSCRNCDISDLTIKFKYW